MGIRENPGNVLQEPLLLRQGLSYPKRLWDLPSPALGLQVFATAPGFLKCVCFFFFLEIKLRSLSLHGKALPDCAAFPASNLDF